MVIVMDMSTGEKLDWEDEYGEEVLNAGWLPQPELALELSSATPARKIAAQPVDVEAFLRNIYLSQE